MHVTHLYLYSYCMPYQTLYCSGTHRTDTFEDARPRATIALFTQTIHIFPKQKKMRHWTMHMRRRWRRRQQHQLSINKRIITEKRERKEKQATERERERKIDDGNNNNNNKNNNNEWKMLWSRPHPASRIQKSTLYMVVLYECVCILSLAVTVHKIRSVFSSSFSFFCAGSIGKTSVTPLASNCG